MKTTNSMSWTIFFGICSMYLMIKTIPYSHIDNTVISMLIGKYTRFAIFLAAVLEIFLYMVLDVGLSTNKGKRKEKKSTGDAHHKKSRKRSILCVRINYTRHIISSRALKFAGVSNYFSARWNPRAPRNLDRRLHNCNSGRTLSFSLCFFLLFRAK